MEPISTPHFTLVMDEDSGRAVLRMGAEFDHGCAREMRTLVDEQLSAGVDVTIDLTRLDFVDSTGIYALLLCTQRAAELERSLHISGPLRPQPLRTLRLTGMDTKLAIDPIR